MSDLATNRDLLLWSEIWKKSKSTDRRRVSAKKPLLEIKQMSAICLVQVEVFRWRSGWDSNPRAVAGKLISSQPRYDHFDTAAYQIPALHSALLLYHARMKKTSIFLNNGKIRL